MTYREAKDNKNYNELLQFKKELDILDKIRSHNPTLIEFVKSKQFLLVLAFTIFCFAILYLG
jgi:hypothetical protein